MLKMPDVMSKYGNMVVKRYIRTAGMQAIVIKQVMNDIYSLKCQNTDIHNLSFVFLEIFFVWYKTMALS